LELVFQVRTLKISVANGDKNLRGTDQSIDHNQDCGEVRRRSGDLASLGRKVSAEKSLSIIHKRIMEGVIRTKVARVKGPWKITNGQIAGHQY